ncbi:MAG: hypothetical protein M1838_003766 [Thelocarpon superellum]|nr:MAG: hypothetical protein M1838_003766 [Thelocarpon superellum]
MDSSGLGESLEGHASHTGQNAFQLSRSQLTAALPNQARRRPQSRASTASAQSFNTQPSQQPVAEADFTFSSQRLEPAHAMSAGGMLMQNAGSLTDHNTFPLDPALDPAGGHGMHYPSATTFMHPQPMPSNDEMDYANFVARESQMHVAPRESNSRTSSEKVAEEKASQSHGRKPSTQSAQNDLELRRLFRENDGRSLQEIATQLQGNERGPQSEKTRQIFAMLWLNAACKKSSGSVPRGRVYSNYVSRCGTERVTVLNPASFGKLVRVMFPAIQTRRLGMRGESKYHYCGLTLEEEPANQVATAAPEAADAPLSFHQPFPTQRGPTPAPQLAADTAVFPSPSAAMSSSQPPRKPRHGGASSSLFWDVNTADLDFNDPSFSSTMIQRELRFPAFPDTAFDQNEPIDLPSIHRHLPSGIDQDTAAALTALYRSHCTSLIDCVRFCRERNFFHLFTSFHGTLTVPVQKLLANPVVAPWIKECDWRMYQTMLRVLAPLTMQVVPMPVVDFLKSMAKNLGAHIKSSFQAYPPHVIEAKLEPATIFASLVDRALRVNLAAHAAANVLSNKANRDQMYEDWVLQVEAVKIVQKELPNCGYSEVLHVLILEIRGLLDPVHLSWEPEPAPDASDKSTSADAEGAASKMQTGLDRWYTFLRELPERFPKADARTIIACVNGIGSSALRDITVGGGRSFSSWWNMKMWIDEMVAFLAEEGGFLAHTLPDPVPTVGDDVTRAVAVVPTTHATQAQSGTESRPETRFSSVDADFGQSIGSQGYDSFSMTDPPTHTFPTATNRLAMTNTSHAALAAAVGFHEEVDHDDSGIGMRMANDELSMTKFSFGSDNHASNGMGGDGTNDLGGSDVIVC